MATNSCAYISRLFVTVVLLFHRSSAFIVTMKCTIPEISWHNRDPVLSVDVQPKTNSKEQFHRLASGGTDSHVLVSSDSVRPLVISCPLVYSAANYPSPQIWYMTVSNEDHDHVKLELAADLARHQRAVNVVRWSPSGELLASGDDESVIFVWKKKEDNEVVNILGA